MLLAPKDFENLYGRTNSKISPSIRLCYVHLKFPKIQIIFIRGPFIKSVSVFGLFFLSKNDENLDMGSSKL